MPKADSDHHRSITRAADPEALRHETPGSLEEGADTIRRTATRLPLKPGVYRMIDAKGEVLYVGKAKSLKKRVSQYAQVARQPTRLKRMIAQVKSIEVIETHTEVEALLLEANMIKRLTPPYNILLRDDKSFPYILITGDHDYPQIVKHRGTRKASEGARKGDYFGPFANGYMVTQTVTTLQRAFMLRNCSDNVFASRTRPCLQYQIKRCTAPCVGRVTKDEYGSQVREALAFLSGRSHDVQARLADRMQQASDALEFEEAARLRDRIKALTDIQAHQTINAHDVDDADIMALHKEGGQNCLQVFFFRNGRNYGNHAYYPRADALTPPEQVLSAFIAQFYANKPIPPKILLNQPIEGHGLLAAALTQSAGHKVDILVPRRGEKRQLVEHAELNAREALARRQAESANQRRLLEGMAAVFGLEQPPRRIEVYDNSHIQGAHPVGAMIVAGPEGLMKQAYRKFNIKDNITPGDDYAMMREVMRRRFQRALKEDPERTHNTWPDVVLIDGGKGQLNVACEVFADLGITDVTLIGVAKGPDRHAGREHFFVPGQEPISLEMNDPVLYYLQRLRDEAHRFAIGTHRSKREKTLSSSPLDDIPGIGPKRKKALLHHFGSAKAVAAAGLSDLEAVNGINKAVAQIIYDHFHDSR